MAYVIVLIGILTAFVWASPARGPVTQAVRESLHTLAARAAGTGEPLATEALHLLGDVREKALEVLRAQIHGAVDEFVK